MNAVEPWVPPSHSSAWPSKLLSHWNQTVETDKDAIGHEPNTDIDVQVQPCLADSLQDLIDTHDDINTDESDDRDTDSQDTHKSGSSGDVETSFPVSGHFPHHHSANSIHPETTDRTERATDSDDVFNAIDISGMHDLPTTPSMFPLQKYFHFQHNWHIDAEQERARLIHSILSREDCCGDCNTDEPTSSASSETVDQEADIQCHQCPPIGSKNRDNISDILRPNQTRNGEVNHTGFPDTTQSHHDDENQRQDIDNCSDVSHSQHSANIETKEKSNCSDTLRPSQDAKLEECTVKADDDDTESSGAGNKRKKARRKDTPGGHSFPLMLPPCRVCGDKASGFHYGANTCEACKGFFRRTLAKKRVYFPCRCGKEDKGAWESGPVRNGCPACRYERCLLVGMDKKAIKIGRYTLMRRTENIQEVKTLENLTQNSCPLVRQPTAPNSCHSRRTSLECNHGSLVPISSNHVVEPQFEPPMKRPRIDIPPVNSFIDNTLNVSQGEVDTIVHVLIEAKKKHCPKHCVDRTERLARIKQSHDECYERYKLKTALFGEMKPLSKREHMEIYRATGIDIDDRLEDIRGAVEFFNRKVRILIDFAKAIPGFKDLELDDQAALIKATRVESSFIGSYRRFLLKCNMDLQVTVTPWGKAYHLNELTKIYPKEFITLRFILAREVESLGLTVGEEMLMRAIAITSGKHCQLREPCKVSDINRKMVHSLHLLLSKRPGGADHLMFRVFETLEKFQDLRELDNKVSRELFLGWPSLSNYHLLTEFFS